MNHRNRPDLICLVRIAISPTRFASVCGAWLCWTQVATAEPDRVPAEPNAPSLLPPSSREASPVQRLLTPTVAMLRLLAPHGATAQSLDVRDEEGNSEETDKGGPLGPLRLGITIGTGLPNVLSVTGLFKITPYLGGGINFGLIPTVRVSYYGEATLRYQEFDAFGRVYPFGGGLFLGVGVGYESVKGTLANSMDTSVFAAALPPNVQLPNPIVYDSVGSVRSLILTPQIGYLYTADIGFSMGIDIGAQVPIAPSQVSFATRLTTPPDTPPQVQEQVRTQLVDPNDARVRSTLKTIGQTPIPTVNLRIGWLF